MFISMSIISIPRLNLEKEKQFTPKNFVKEFNSMNEKDKEFKPVNEKRE